MDEMKFRWDEIGDIALGRPNLGGTVDVSIYRLMQFTMRKILQDQLGEETASSMFRSAGRQAGLAYCAQFLDVSLPLNEFLAQLYRQLIENQVGVLRVEQAQRDPLHFVMTISEDLDCSGLPVNGMTVCDYDEGFIAGVLEAYTGLVFTVQEIDCWVTGGRTCRFDAQLAGVPNR